jgi:ATP-binding cassette, subfamily C (CFTR/MRP), member 1
MHIMPGQSDPCRRVLFSAVLARDLQSCDARCALRRINTILDSNKVLVMDDGVVAEYAAPAELMQQPESAFRSMVVEAGLGAGFGAEERRPDP